VLQFRFLLISFSSFASGVNTCKLLNDGQHFINFRRLSGFATKHEWCLFVTVAFHWVTKPYDCAVLHVLSSTMRLDNDTAISLVFTVVLLI